MARAVKKTKKEKQGNKKGLFIGIGIGAALIVITTIVLLVIFLSDGIDKIDYNTREITLEELTSIVDGETSVGDFEKTIYVYVYSSDIETHTNCNLDDSTYNRLKSLISTEKKLRASYELENYDMESRMAFYTLDIYDEDNEGILNNSKFLNKTEAGFVLKIVGESVSDLQKDNELKQTFYELNYSYFAPEADKFN
ncbi:MAG: hypothetical protein R3Y05_02505 [bacterium]